MSVNDTLHPAGTKKNLSFYSNEISFEKKLPTAFEHFIKITLIFSFINNYFEHALNLTASFEFELDMI